MRSRWLPLLPLVSIWLGCSDPKPVVVAAFPPDSGADVGAAGAAGADAGSTSPLVPTPRGRVQISGGALVTDLGTPLRGAILAADSATWTLGDFDMLTRIAQSSGLNMVHVYLENSSLDVGSREAEGDALVSLAAQAGLYVILGYGTGTNVGTFDTAKAQAFWTLYAARYAASTHVLFEIQNNPDKTGCGQAIPDATLTFERDTYGLIRGLAPDSHILLFSSYNVPQVTTFTGAVTGLGSSVSFANASFAMTMTTDCLAPADFSTLIQAANTQGVPLFMSQLTKTNWAAPLQAFEAAGLGWTQFNWFATESDVPSFVSAIQSAGISWCPERGTFPEDSTSCAAMR